MKCFISDKINVENSPLCELVIAQLSILQAAFTFFQDLKIHLDFLMFVNQEK